MAYNFRAKCYKHKKGPAIAGPFIERTVSAANATIPVEVYAGIAIPMTAIRRWRRRRVIGRRRGVVAGRRRITVVITWAIGPGSRASGEYAKRRAADNARGNRASTTRGGGCNGPRKGRGAKTHNKAGLNQRSSFLEQDPLQKGALRRAVSDSVSGQFRPGPTSDSKTSP